MPKVTWMSTAAAAIEYAGLERSQRDPARVATTMAMITATSVTYCQPECAFSRKSFMAARVRNQRPSGHSEASCEPDVARLWPVGSGGGPVVSIDLPSRRALDLRQLPPSG